MEAGAELLSVEDAADKAVLQRPAFIRTIQQVTQSHALCDRETR